MTVFNPLDMPVEGLPRIMAVITGESRTDTVASVYSQGGEFITTRVSYNRERLNNELIKIAPGSDLYARYTAIYPRGWRAEFVEPNDPTLLGALAIYREAKHRPAFGLDA